MPREYRTHQPLHQPPAPRVIEGQLVATRVERRPVRLALPRPAISWGRLALRAAGVLAASAAAVGLVWALLNAVAALISALLVLVALVVAWVQAHLWLIVLAAALPLFLLIRLTAAGGGGHRCAGLHCRGCRR